MTDKPHNDITAVLGHPDNLKFRSSMTLFATVAPDEALIEEALHKYFGGEPDQATLRVLQQNDG